MKTGRYASALFGVLLLALSVAGCARAKAKTVPTAPPALEMPPPPPRDVETNETEPPPPAVLPQEPARNAPPRPRPAPAQQPRVEPPRQEPPKPEVPPEGEQPKPAEEAPKPPTTLQTAPAEAEVDLERNIRETLTRASNGLNRIDYRILDSNGRSQYDTAKGFIRQADSAIRAKNLVFAKSLADKAATIASQLGGK
jgi:outer membrane biosynthesis protein TonB